MTEKRLTTTEEAKRVGDEIGVDWGRFDLQQFRSGMDVEFEHGSHDPHTDVTGDDPIVTGTIALAHLKAATPGDPKVTALDGKLATAQITKMLADGNLDRAAALVKGAQQSGAVPEAQINKWRSEIGRRQDDARGRDRAQPPPLLERAQEDQELAGEHARARHGEGGDADSSSFRGAYF